jgi:hypothetical protein
MEGEPDVQRTSERKLLPSPAIREQKGEAFKEGHRMKGPVAVGVVCVHITRASLTYRGAPAASESRKTEANWIGILRRKGIKGSSPFTKYLQYQRGEP